MAQRWHISGKKTWQRPKQDGSRIDEVTRYERFAARLKWMKEELGEDGLKRLLFSKQAIGDGLVMRSTLDPEKLEITCVVEDSDHFIDRNLRRANYTWRKNPPEIDNPQ